jgi:hypothetical protein
MFGERTSRDFCRFEGGVKAILFEQDQVFNAAIRIEIFDRNSNFPS